MQPLERHGVLAVHLLRRRVRDHVCFRHHLCRRSVLPELGQQLPIGPGQRQGLLVGLAVLERQLRRWRVLRHGLLGHLSGVQRRQEGRRRRRRLRERRGGLRSGQRVPRRRHGELRQKRLLRRQRCLRQVRGRHELWQHDLQRGSAKRSFVRRVWLLRPLERHGVLTVYVLRQLLCGVVRFRQQLHRFGVLPQLGHLVPTGPGQRQ